MWLLLNLATGCGTCWAVCLDSRGFCAERKLGPSEQPMRGWREGISEGCQGSLTKGVLTIVKGRFRVHEVIEGWCGCLILRSCHVYDIYAMGSACLPRGCCLFSSGFAWRWGTGIVCCHAYFG